MSHPASARSSITLPSSPQNDLEKQDKVALEDQSNLLPTKQVVIVFAGCGSALFLSLLDQTIIATALPVISSYFNAGSESTWVASSYLLTSTAFTPIVSRLSDIFGRKRIFLASLFIFWLGSLLSAISQSMIQLIVFRAIQGIGGGALPTLTMITVSDVVALRDRGKFQGILGAIVAVANGVGPLVGGVLAEKASWRWTMWLGVIIAPFSAIVVIFCLPLIHPKQGSMKDKLLKIDYVGSLLSLVASVLILLGLNWAGTQYAWDSAYVLAPLVIGIATIPAFCIWEWKRAKLPIVPMRLFDNQTTTVCLLTTFINGIIYYSQLFYVPQFFQVVRGDSAIMAGVLLLPLILIQTLSSSACGQIVSRTGSYRPLIWGGWALFSIGLGLLSILDDKSPIGMVVGFLLVCGIGSGGTLQTLLVAIQSSVAKEDLAVSTGVRNYLRMMGGTLSLAISATILNTSLRTRASQIPPEILQQTIDDPTILHRTSDITPTQVATLLSAYVHGFRILFILLASLAAFSFVISVACMKHYALPKAKAEEKEKSKKWLEERKSRHAKIPA